MTNTDTISLSLFERCNIQAEANKAAQWERIHQEQNFALLKYNGRTGYKVIGKHWWQDKDLWADDSPPYSPTEAQAIENVYRECGGVVSSLWQVLVEITSELIQEDQQRRYGNHQKPLREVLAERGVTLEWHQLKATDSEPTRFEVPLKRAG